MTPKSRRFDFDELQFDHLMIQYKNEWLRSGRPDIPHGELLLLIKKEIERNRREERHEFAERIKKYIEADDQMENIRGKPYFIIQSSYVYDIIDEELACLDKGEPE